VPAPPYLESVITGLLVGPNTLAFVNYVSHLLQKYAPDARFVLTLFLNVVD